MKIKRATIHIENPKTKKLFFEDDPLLGYSVRSFCGRDSDSINCEIWEIVRNMKPLCKACLRVMGAREGRGK